MPLAWITGLYGPVRDISQALARRQPPRLRQTIEATHLGGKTWVVIAVWCEGSKSVNIRGCFAELYVHAYDSCVEPYPVRTRAIGFYPSGIVKLSPGDSPVYWKTQIANDYARRLSREHNAVETLKAYGKRGPEVHADQIEREKWEWARRETVLSQVVRALACAESVGIRAVIETTDGGEVATARIAVPPAEPIIERLCAAATVLRQAISDRSKAG